MEKLTDGQVVEYLQGLREDLENSVIDEDLQALDRAIECTKGDLHHALDVISEHIDNMKNYDRDDAYNIFYNLKRRFWLSGIMDKEEL